MKYKKFMKACCGCLLGMLLLETAVPVTGFANETGNAKPAHGTATEWITEDMLNNTPPANYQVNGATQGEAETGAYSAYFLEDGIQKVDISIEENNLNYLLQNAAKEPYVMADSVTIGDITVGYCGLKTK